MHRTEGALELGLLQIDYMKKNISLTVAMVFSLVVVFYAGNHVKDIPFFQNTNSLVDLVSRTRKSIYQLEVIDDAGQKKTGTGFLISPGLIATNYHVIEDGQQVEIVTNGGSRGKASCVYNADLEQDIAILRVNNSTEVPLPFGSNITTVPVGLSVSVIGNPLGLEGSVSQGVVAAIRTESIEGLPRAPLIQLTAPVSPGSSGSPLFDAEGGVLGVVTVASLGNAQNINFAVPIDAVRTLLEKGKNLPCRDFKSLDIDTTFAKAGYDPRNYPICGLCQWSEEAKALGYDDAKHAKAWGSIYRISKYLIKRCSDCAYYYQWGAVAAFKIGRYEWADRTLNASIGACSGSPIPSRDPTPHFLSKSSCWENAALQLMDADLFQKAGESYGKAIQLNPSSIEAWDGEGNALAHIGNLKDSEDSYKKAITIAEKDLNQVVGEAQQLGMLQDPNVVSSISMDMASLSQAVSLLGEFYGNYNRPDDGVTLLNDFYRDKQGLFDDFTLLVVSEAWEAIGQGFQKSGRGTDAIGAFEMAVSYWNKCLQLEYSKSPDFLKNNPSEKDICANTGVVDYRWELIVELYKNNQNEKAEELIQQMRSEGRRIGEEDIAVLKKRSEVPSASPKDTDR